MQALYNCELNLDLLIYMEPLFKKFRQKWKLHRWMHHSL